MVPKWYLKTMEESRVNPDFIQEGKRTRSQTHHGLVGQHDISYQQAQNDSCWKEAMNEEMESIYNNKT